MAKKYLPPKCNYTVEGNHIVTDGTVMNKMTGTSIGGIFGVSAFNTPFQIACALLGVAREDISDKPAVKVGQLLETDIIRYAGKMYSSYGTFNTAEEVFTKREGDHDSWASDFEDQYFAGHVDGIIMSDDGEDYILEVKTSRNLDAWVDNPKRNNVPEYYFWQVALYNHFITKKDKAYVLLGMVDEKTYTDVNSWTAGSDTITMFEMPIDREEVANKLEEAKDWYREFIENGVTPDYDPNDKGDVEMFAHLVAMSADVKDIQGMVNEVAAADERIKAHEAEIKDLYDRRDALKGNIKEYLECHGIEKLVSESGQFMATVSISNRKGLDEERMIADGIDLDKYRKTTQVKTLSIKPIKVKK